MTMTNANDHFGTHNGTEHIYSVRPFPFTYTDGVKELVDNCQCYWLIDVILSYQVHESINKQQFQVWRLTRVKDDTFSVVATDGNENKIISQYIPYSDFKFDQVTIWLVNGTILLPSEY